MRGKNLGLGLSGPKKTTSGGGGGSAPTNTVAPMLIASDLMVGYPIEVDPGTFTDADTVEWILQRSTVDISGSEDVDPYTPVPDDRGANALRVKVTATNANGSTVVYSDPVTVLDAPLRGVVTQNRGPTGTESRTNKSRHNYRWPYVIPFDCYELKISNQAWLMGTGAEAALANGFTIEAQSLKVGSTIEPVLYSAGRSQAMTAGQTDIHSDSILPSDYGLSIFAAGTTIWLKGFNSSTSTFAQPYCPTLVANVAGSQIAWWDHTVAGTDATNATWIAQTDSDGVYTTAPFSGTQSFDTRVNGYRPMILGRFTDDLNSPSWVCIGDSIFESSTDNNSDMVEAQRIHGTAAWHRMMRNADGSYCPAVINLSRGGVPANVFHLGTRAKQFYKYARKGGDGAGTNTLSTVANLTGLNTLKSDCTTNWGEMRAAGVEEILRTHLLPRTTSTDAYATTANQTYNTGWGVGEFSQQFSDWCDSELIAGNIDYVLPMMAARDGTFPLKWAVPSKTSDGTHPLTLTHEALGVENRPTTVAII